MIDKNEIYIRTKVIRIRSWLRMRLDGGPGSGNFNHEGRKGEVGGSAPGGGSGGSTEKKSSSSKGEKEHEEKFPHNKKNWYGKRGEMIRKFYIGLIRTISEFQPVNVLVPKKDFLTIPERIAVADRPFPASFFTVKKDGTKWILEGKGFGHGVGMCQMGVRARAQAGQSYIEILSHYYPGITLERFER